MPDQHKQISKKLQKDEWISEWLNECRQTKTKSDNNKRLHG